MQHGQMVECDGCRKMPDKRVHCDHPAWGFCPNAGHDFSVTDCRCVPVLALRNLKNGGSYRNDLCTFSSFIQGSSGGKTGATPDSRGGWGHSGGKKRACADRTGTDVMAHMHGDIYMYAWTPHKIAPFSNWYFKTTKEEWVVRGTVPWRSMVMKGTNHMTRLSHALGYDWSRRTGDCPWWPIEDPAVQDKIKKPEPMEEPEPDLLARPIGDWRLKIDPNLDFQDKKFCRRNAFRSCR